MWRWGKAGQRLSTSQQRQRHAEVVRRTNRDRAEQERREQDNYRRWERGELVPNQITMALDLRQLDGPEVDRACHAREPAVDRWEAGQEYPRWDQLVALAELTGHPVAFFFAAIEPVPFKATSLGCPRSGGYAPPKREPVLEFEPDAIEATVHPQQPGLF